MSRKEHKYDEENLEERNCFSKHNHILPESVEPDRAVFRMEIWENSLNPYGFVHGGALYALADNACGYAAHTDGRNYVTLEGSLHFVSNRGKGTVLATAQVIHRGGTTCVVNADITDESGEMLATGQFTFFCIKT